MPSTFSRMAPKLQAAICLRESEVSELPLVPVSCWCRRSIGIGEAIELALAGIAATQPGDLVAEEISPFVLIAPKHAESWLCYDAPPHLCMFQVDTQEQYLALVESLVADRRQHRDQGL